MELHHQENAAITEEKESWPRDHRLYSSIIQVQNLVNADQRHDST